MGYYFELVLFSLRFDTMFRKHSKFGLRLFPCLFVVRKPTVLILQCSHTV